MHYCDTSYTAQCDVSVILIPNCNFYSRYRCHVNAGSYSAKPKRHFNASCYCSVLHRCKLTPTCLFCSRYRHQFNAARLFEKPCVISTPHNTAQCYISVSLTPLWHTELHFNPSYECDFLALFLEISVTLTLVLQ